MAKISASQLRKCVYPYPVYEAHFTDGSCQRMTVWQPLGKPWDFPRFRRLFSCLTRTRSKTIAYGLLHHGGLEYMDPMLPEAAPVKRPTARQYKDTLRDLLRSLDRGRPDAAIVAKAHELVTGRA